MDESEADVLTIGGEIFTSRLLLGTGGVPSLEVLERAIVAMLQVPVVEGSIDLEETGATQYRYVEPRLQQLSAAQKQLLRMGPSNVRTIQAKLRQIAQALGYRIPN